MTAPESRSGLPAWGQAELPPAPNPRGLGWMSVVGPGVIVLGVTHGRNGRLRSKDSYGNESPRRDREH